MAQFYYRGGFRELNTWKEAREFRKKISELTKGLPAHEKYRLTDQLYRASRGITNCIAEGYGRYHYQENMQFCRMARGSLMECLDHLVCALDEGYISDSTFKEMEKRYKDLLKMLNGYIAYLRREKYEGGR